MPRVIHFDIAADDPERAVAFYRQAFGWEIAKWEGPMEYWLVRTGPEGEPGIDGGIGQRSAPGEGTANTIGVESMDAALAAVEAAGGRGTFPKGYLPGVGWMSYCEDTEGNTFGLLQADARTD